tara:strand:+ start:156 stop:1148 length:993 start_codon:yes stop_codon:yes gene_type:complete
MLWIFISLIYSSDLWNLNQESLQPISRTYIPISVRISDYNEFSINDYTENEMPPYMDAVYLGVGHYFLGKKFRDYKTINNLYILSNILTPDPLKDSYWDNYRFEYSYDWNPDDKYYSPISNIKTTIFGYKKGITSNNYNYQIGIEYISSTVFTSNFSDPTKNYSGFNLNFSIGQVLSRSDWGYFGYSATLLPKQATSPSSNHNAIDLALELPALAVGAFAVAAGLIIGVVAVIAALAETGSDSDLYGNNSSGSSKGCHVYGNIKFVDFGEDYKVRFVTLNEDVSIQYVDLYANSPGKWKVVDFGEDYKIKIVSFGEDFTVQERLFKSGCN